jgi:L-methionine (R)-S-oxide reductase
MYDFRIEAGDKVTLYRDLAQALEALIGDETDAVANMANAAGLIWESVPDLNWVGFYRNVGGELVLGPFQGRAACIRIPFGKGVCGAAAASLEPQCVADVHAFPGHIACDAASRSELVVRVKSEGRAGPLAPGRAAAGGGRAAPARLLAVIDLDSPTPGRFDAEDVAGCVELAQRLAPRLAGMAKGPAGR